MAFDIKGIESQINGLRIGYNKEENKISVENTDKSTHVHYHIHLSLPKQIISKIENNNIEKLVKETTLRTVKKALEDKPQDMYRIAGLYNPVAFSTGASGVVLSSAPNTLDQGGTMPSGDFINQLPGIIESSIQANESEPK